jgi:hypothetical protein
VLWTAGDWLRSFAGFLRHRVTGPWRRPVARPRSSGARRPPTPGGSADAGATILPGPGTPVTTGGPPGPGSPYAAPAHRAWRSLRPARAGEATAMKRGAVR